MSLQTLKSNGIKFYTSDVSGNFTGTTFLDLPYSEQTLLNQRQRASACGYEIVNFNETSTFVLLSDAAATVTVYNSSSVDLSGAIAASSSFTFGVLTGYVFNVDFSTFAIDSGGYLIAGNGAEYLRSEPLQSPTNILKLTFDKTYINTTVTQTAYLTGLLKSFSVEQLDRVFGTSANRYERLLHSEKQSRVIESFALPPYKIEQLTSVFKNEGLALTIPTASGAATDNIRLLQGENINIQQIEGFNLATLTAKIVYDESLTFNIFA